MIQGDFVYITDDSWSTSPEHWVSGTSWLTGQAGYLPKNFVTQMAETNTWTVHIALPLCEREIPPTSIPSSTSTGECDFFSLKWGFEPVIFRKNCVILTQWATWKNFINLLLTDVI